MERSPTALARIFLYCFGLGHPLLVVWMVGAFELVSDRLLVARFSSLEALLLLAFILCPSLAAVIDDYLTYVLAAGLFIVRVPLEITGLLSLMPVSSLVVVPVYVAIAIISLWLASERVALEVTGNILTLNWSLTRRA